MNATIGSIDHLGRPIINISTPAPFAESLVCILDTGFNRSLLLNRTRALELGFQELPNLMVDEIVFASGQTAHATIMIGTIQWMGRNVPVNAHVVSHGPFHSGERELEGLIGTELLTGMRVVLDFHLKTIQVEQNDRT